MCYLISVARIVFWRRRISETILNDSVIIGIHFTRVVWPGFYPPVSLVWRAHIYDFLCSTHIRNVYHIVSDTLVNNSTLPTFLPMIKVPPGRRLRLCDCACECHIVRIGELWCNWETTLRAQSAPSSPDRLAPYPPAQYQHAYSTNILGNDSCIHCLTLRNHNAHTRNPRLFG